jgi:hypothetical protein
MRFRQAIPGALLLLWLASGLVRDALAQAASKNAKGPQAITLLLTSGGFAAKTVVAKQGYYLIDIINRTNSTSIQLQLDRIVPNAKTVVSGQGRSRFRNLQNLTPGTYRLSVADRPGWICTIEVN